MDKAIRIEDQMLVTYSIHKKQRQIFKQAKINNYIEENRMELEKQYADLHHLTLTNSLSLKATFYEFCLFMYNSRF